MEKNIEMRECLTIGEFTECVQLQRDVFGWPESEISPVRHFVVTKNAGGFALGTFDANRLVGFVLSVPAFLRGERAFYSHMTAVRPDYQSHGIGAQLKWAQRERALSEGVKFIKWTFEPVKAKNAYFNIEKLGVVIREYKSDFYSSDYSQGSGEVKVSFGLDSDRVFAEWNLQDEKVIALSQEREYIETSKPIERIEIVNDWPQLVKTDVRKAVVERGRIRTEFQSVFAKGLVCRGFERNETRPQYLLFDD